MISLKRQRQATEDGRKKTENGREGGDSVVWVSVIQKEMCGSPDRLLWKRARKKERAQQRLQRHMYRTENITRAFGMLRVGELDAEHSVLLWDYGVGGGCRDTLIHPSCW